MPNTVKEYVIQIQLTGFFTFKEKIQLNIPPAMNILRGLR